LGISNWGGITNADFRNYLKGLGQKPSGIQYRNDITKGGDNSKAPSKAH